MTGRHARALRSAVLLTAVATAGVGAGCGLSSFTNSLGGGILGGGNAVPEAAKAPEDELLVAARGDGQFTGSLGEISTNCPRVTVVSRDNNVTVYEQGRAGDALGVMHRGELSKASRECAIEGNRVTVKYGVQGRVLLGPKGRSGLVALPLKVALTDAKREAVRSDNMRIETTVTLEKPIGYFTAVRTVTFDVPVGSRAGEFEINVSFDRNIPGAG